MAGRPGMARRTLEVETALEARTRLDNADDLDRGEDAARARAKASVRRMLGALTEEERLDELGDLERHHAKALIVELCGLLDGVPAQAVLFPVVALSGDGARNVPSPVRAAPERDQALVVRASGVLSPEPTTDGPPSELVAARAIRRRRA